jgi:hypothetical protein
MINRTTMIIIIDLLKMLFIHPATQPAPAGFFAPEQKI